MSVYDDTDVVEIVGYGFISLEWSWCDVSKNVL